MARETGLQVRPYPDLYDNIWEILDSSIISSPTVRYSKGDYKLTKEQLTNLGSSDLYAEIEISNNEISQLVSQDGLSLDGIRLSIYSYSKETNLGSVIYSERLADIHEHKVKIKLSGVTREEADPLLACVNGFSVTILLTLNAHRINPKSNLSPRAKHSILARTSFRFLSHSDEGAGLVFNQLTDELREVEKIPKLSAIYIKSLENPVTSEKLADCLSVYIDSNLLNRIDISRGRSIGKLYITKIGIEILSDVVMRSSIELNRQIAETGNQQILENLDGTVVLTLIKMLSKKGQLPGQRLSNDELLEELIEKPEKSITRVQALWSAKSRFMDAFEEGIEQ